MLYCKITNPARRSLPKWSRSGRAKTCNALATPCGHRPEARTARDASEREGGGKLRPRIGRRRRRPGRQVNDDESHRSGLMNPSAPPVIAIHRHLYGNLCGHLGGSLILLWKPWWMGLASFQASNTNIKLTNDAAMRLSGKSRNNPHA